MIKTGTAYSFETKKDRDSWLTELGSREDCPYPEALGYLDREFDKEETFRFIAGLWIVPKWLLCGLGIEEEEWI